MTAVGSNATNEPAAFVAAMLKSQPMSFYSPSQLVQDAKRHGIEVVPIDVTVSGWDSVLVRVNRAR
jgi:error-prone DNA polymerase